MSLTYVGTITPTGSVTLTDAVANETLQQLYVVESTGPSFRQFNLHTLAQVASSVVSATATCVAILNSASAVVGNTSNGTIDFIELATSYRTTQSGGAAIYGTVKGQKMAGDSGNGVAFGVTTTANTLTKITSTPTVGTVNIGGLVNFFPTCIILKSSGRFLVGGRFGKIYEVDTSGVIQDELTVTLDNNTGILSDYNGNRLQWPTVEFLSYDNNILAIATDDSFLIYDYSTKTKLWEQPSADSNAANQLVLCAASSGETLKALDVITSAPGSRGLSELNFTTYGPQIPNLGTLFTGSGNSIFCTGFCASLSFGFALQATDNKIRVVLVSATPTTVQTFNCPTGYNNARLLVLDDTLGVGSTLRVLDTYQNTGNTYRVPTGKTLILLWKCITGTNALWYESRVNT